MTDQKTHSEPESFEDAMGRLQAILKRLERGEVSLDQTIKLYNDAAKLRRFCKEKLDSFQAQVDVIEQAQGEPDAVRRVPFERVVERRQEQGKNVPE